jgi:uncharacterized protein (DUF697 family)
LPSWNDFGNIWTTLKDVDVNAVRDEAMRPLLIAVVGHEQALAEVSRLLSASEDRYPAAGVSPLLLLPLTEAAGLADQVRGSNLLILAVDAARGLNEQERGAFTQIDRLGLPAMVVVLGGSPAPLSGLPPAAAARAVVLPDASAIDAADTLATEVLRQLPSELQLAAARRLPGLRAMYARELINNTSFSNASYALATGIPEQIPVISIPFAAADMLVLTKNQAMLTYRLALAYGAPPGFQERLTEVIPVIGSGFLWRQLARSLIGLIPVWGLVPKVAVAYAGTYTTGVAAWRWFERGELTSTDQLRRISQDALKLGQQRASEIVTRAREAGERARSRANGQQRPGLLGRIRSRLPFGRRPPAIAAPQPDKQQTPDE